MPESCNFIKKETLAQVFYCEFYEISKNTFFQRIALVAASVNFDQILDNLIVRNMFTNYLT